MKDLLGTDRFGFERIFIQLFLPGLIATAPFIWAFHITHRDLPNGEVVPFLRGNKEVALVLVFAIAIIAGLVIEDLASRIETAVLDELNRKQVDLNLVHIWRAYLKTTTNTTTPLAVIPGYNSALVVRLKFELSMALALLFTCSGLLLLLFGGRLHTTPLTIVFIFVALLLSICYLAWEARDSTRVLHRNRVLILEANGALPSDYSRPNMAIPINPTPPLRTFSADAGVCKQCSTYLLEELRATAANDYILVRRKAVAMNNACTHFNDHTAFWVHRELLG